MVSCDKLSVELRLFLGFVVGVCFGLAASAFFDKLAELKALDALEVKAHVEYDHLYNDDDSAHLNTEETPSTKVRVLCLVLTYPKNHHMAYTVKITWGKRCDVLLLMSTEEDKNISTIALPVREGYNVLWGKVKASFWYIYRNHLDDFDWVLKADDNTYVVMENLKYMLAQYNASEAVYFGRRFQVGNGTQGWMSGGAGYVQSKQAFRNLVEEGLAKQRCREEDNGAEDYETSACIEITGGRPGDSRDSLERGRFHPFTPEGHLFPYDDPGFWYTKYNVYRDLPGIACCSQLAISFHYLSQYDLLTLEYQAYHLRHYSAGYNVSSTLPLQR